jgi:hypothetical protein
MYNKTDEMCLKLENLKLGDKITAMSPEDFEKKVKGDKNQAERLLAAKKNK